VVSQAPSWHIRGVEPEASQSRAAESDEERKRKRKRLGVIIRVLIYIPLLAFFGWRASEKFLQQRRMADDNFRTAVEQWLQHPPRTIIMPNGEAMPVLELSEQEAVEMGLLPEPEAKPEPEPPEATTTAAN
jgi:hypothetical protein